MEAVEEARVFAQAKIHDRIGSLRTRARRLKQLDKDECLPDTAKESKKEQDGDASHRQADSAGLQSRERSLDGLRQAPRRRRPSGRPVLAFSFKTPSAPKPALERDGSVSSTFHLSLPPPSSPKPQLSFRLECRAAWSPSPLSARRPSKSCSAGSWCQPGQACRGGTWGETGFAGLLGSGSREFSGFETKPELRPDCGGMCLDADEQLPECVHTEEGAQLDELHEAFWQVEPKQENRISTGSGLHQALRWLGHCHTFERLQQLIYEVDPEGTQLLDFTAFVRLVLNCRDFERRAAVAAFHAADARTTGLLDDQAASGALQQLGLEGKLPSRETGMDLNDFLLLVARLQKERLPFLRANFFSPVELGTLRLEFNRVAAAGSGKVNRQELENLVEQIFPAHARSPKFRSILVRLLNEKSQGVKFLEFLSLICAIREEAERLQCAVYAQTIRHLEFSFREASEFLSVFLSASAEARRMLSKDALATLFIHCFEMSDCECHQLHECIALSAKPIPVPSSSVAPTSCSSNSFAENGPSQLSQSPTLPIDGARTPSEETCMDFLDFLTIMRRVIEAGLGGALLKSSGGTS